MTFSFNKTGAVEKRDTPSPFARIVLEVSTELNTEEDMGSAEEASRVSQSHGAIVSQLFETPYEAPPEPKNPVLRGLPLYYGASLISSIQSISRYLWTNAGFTILRNIPELERFPPRYDPTVIPVAPNEKKQSLSSYAQTPVNFTNRSPSSTGSSHFPSVADYHAAYSSGALTPLDVAQELLPLIRRDVPERTEHATAFAQINAEAVLAAAKASTARWEAGHALGLLDGVPIAVKDELDVEGYERKLGSKSVFKTDGTSWCVAALMEAGAIVMGKSSMHELGLDTTNNNPNDGTPLNPYNREYYCGGSSGGSGYAVGTGLVPLALGVDGGGSVRIPSSFCGIYGLKTSHGRISRLPTTNGASSTSVVGPMAANMIDLELGFRILSKSDSAFPSSTFFPPPQAAPVPPTNKILGIYRPWFDQADPSVRKACSAALGYLHKTLGYELVDITIPFLHPGQTAHALTILAEIATTQPSIEDLTPANKILISVAHHTPARDFLLAQRLRELLMRHLAALFQEHPGLIIVTPTTTLPGWHISGGNADLRYGVSDANTSLRNMRYVWLANFSGCPCLQVPVGYVEAVKGGDVPIGMMGMGEWSTDEQLIGFGYDVEKWLHEGLDGGRRRPENFVDILKSLSGK
ncbi:MAG: hypothetical protein M1820_010344 [Bogoriella megaspora]|nr:MAG: hypothetical protein M1820_010344 [Bogoriella megaspora]